MLRKTFRFVNNVLIYVEDWLDNTNRTLEAIAAEEKEKARLRKFDRFDRITDPKLKQAIQRMKDSCVDPDEVIF